MPSFGIERRCDFCLYGTAVQKPWHTTHDEFGCIQHLTTTVISCSRFPETKEKHCNGWCFEFTPTLSVIWGRLKAWWRTHVSAPN